VNTSAIRRASHLIDGTVEIARLLGVAVPCLAPQPIGVTPRMSVRDPAFLRLLILAGLVEGTSTLVLAWAVIMKRVVEHPIGATAVSISGSVHGLLFIGLVGMLFVAWKRVPLSTGLLLAGLVGAVVPFGPFLVDVPLYRMLKASKAS
jgi:integral membrane protein